MFSIILGAGSIVSSGNDITGATLENVVLNFKRNVFFNKNKILCSPDAKGAPTSENTGYDFMAECDRPVIKIICKGIKMRLSTYSITKVHFIKKTLVYGIGVSSFFSVNGDHCLSAELDNYNNFFGTKLTYSPVTKNSEVTTVINKGSSLLINEQKFRIETDMTIRLKRCLITGKGTGIAIVPKNLNDQGALKYIYDTATNNIFEAYNFPDVVDVITENGTKCQIELTPDVKFSETLGLVHNDCVVWKISHGTFVSTYRNGCWDHVDNHNLDVIALTKEKRADVTDPNAELAKIRQEFRDYRNKMGTLIKAIQECLN